MGYKLCYRKSDHDELTHMGFMEEIKKPDRCFSCGCTKFCWTLEKGWACLRCDPPPPGILGLIKRGRHSEPSDETPVNEV